MTVTPTKRKRRRKAAPKVDEPEEPASEPEEPAAEAAPQVDEPTAEQRAPLLILPEWLVEDLVEEAVA